jgi:hypothetical protein
MPFIERNIVCLLKINSLNRKNNGSNMMETILPFIHIKNLSTSLDTIFSLFITCVWVFFFEAFDLPFECNMVDVLNDNHVKHLRKLNNG